MRKSENKKEGDISFNIIALKSFYNGNFEFNIFSKKNNGKVYPIEVLHFYVKINEEISFEDLIKLINHDLIQDFCKRTKSSLFDLTPDSQNPNRNNLSISLLKNSNFLTFLEKNVQKNIELTATKKKPNGQIELNYRIISTVKDYVEKHQLSLPTETFLKKIKLKFDSNNYSQNDSRQILDDLHSKIGDSTVYVNDDEIKNIYDAIEERQKNVASDSIFNRILKPISITVILLVIGSILYYGCPSKETELYNESIRTGNYQQYLKEYPRGQYVPNINLALDNLKFEQVSQKGTDYFIKEFIEDCKTEFLKKEAKKMLRKNEKEVKKCCNNLLGKQLTWWEVSKEGVGLTFRSYKKNGHIIILKANLYNMLRPSKNGFDTLNVRLNVSDSTIEFEKEGHYSKGKIYFQGEDFFIESTNVGSYYKFEH